MLSSSSPEYADLIRPEHIDSILSVLRTSLTMSFWIWA